ncbi:hypothetical protein [Dictyobacter arantiisoli]|uniref:hypothetical protein n=1 Tax=Dictyobacter arantiisoli TaxID=2014874 RepID=UPI0011EC8558|nr:hypothetical protein [Dictyobacter arantiisoli]
MFFRFLVIVHAASIQGRDEGGLSPQQEHLTNILNASLALWETGQRRSKACIATYGGRGNEELYYPLEDTLNASKTINHFSEGVVAT